PPVTGSGGAAFFPGSFAPGGGILPALSSPLSPGAILVKVPLAGYYNDAPFAPGLRFIDPANPANDQFQNSSNGMGDITLGVKYRIVDPDKGRFGLAVLGQVAFPTASNFGALSKGRGTGEIDWGFTLAASEEYFGHRLRFMENFGFIKKGDPDSGGVKILDLANEVNLSGGVSYALTKHIETVTELVGTVFVGGSTPDYNRVNPLDYQTGARFHFMEGRVSFGGAYRVNLTRSDLHSNIPGLIFTPNLNGGSFAPVVFNFQSQGVSSFVAYLSFGFREFEAAPALQPVVWNRAPTVNSSITPDSGMNGQGSRTFTITIPA